MEDGLPTQENNENKKSSGIFSVRPKGVELAFLVALTKQHGSAAGALLECIQLAMKAKGEVIIDNPKPEPKPEPKPAPQPVVGYVPVGPIKERLVKIQTRKGITEHQAIEYCITNHI